MVVIHLSSQVAINKNNVVLFAEFGSICALGRHFKPTTKEVYFYGEYILRGMDLINQLFLGVLIDLSSIAIWHKHYSKNGHYGQSINDSIEND